MIVSRRKPICSVPEMVFGNMANDGGNLSDYSNEELVIVMQQLKPKEHFIQSKAEELPRIIRVNLLPFFNILQILSATCRHRSVQESIHNVCTLYSLPIQDC